MIEFIKEHFDVIIAFLGGSTITKFLDYFFIPKSERLDRKNAKTINYINVLENKYLNDFSILIPSRQIDKICCLSTGKYKKYKKHKPEKADQLAQKEVAKEVKKAIKARARLKKKIERLKRSIG